MTDEERTACNAFIKQYIARKQAQGEWDPDPVGLMRVAYGAACEAKQKEVNAEHARAEWLLDLLEDCDQELHRAIVTEDIGVGDRP